MGKRISIFDRADDDWVEEYLKPRYPELVKNYLEASRIFRGAKERGVVVPKELNKLVGLASSSRRPLGQNAASMLGELYEVDKTVAVGIRRLAQGTRVHERINALVALDSCATDSLHYELLAEALSDRSARVRELATDKVENRGMHTLMTPNKSLERTHEK
jgi:hypothetical protein